MKILTTEKAFCEVPKGELWLSYPSNMLYCSHVEYFYTYPDNHLKSIMVEGVFLHVGNGWLAWLNQYRKIWI